MDRILSFEASRTMAVKPLFLLAAGLACCLAAPVLRAQGTQGRKADDSGRNKPASVQKPGRESTQKPSAAQPPSNANPFPTDLSTVPIIPTANSPSVSEGAGNGMGNGRYTLPDSDSDPVPSPNDAGSATTDGQRQGFSSSQTGLGPLLPDVDGNAPGSRNPQKQNSIFAPLPQPTAKQDISVGNFYLDTGDWRGAYSRFQSALVLDPSNPDVYWGLAECQRHMGQYAAARENYLKVMEYDAGGKYAKKAAKALRNPDIANAEPSGQAQQ